MSLTEFQASTFQLLTEKEAAKRLCHSLSTLRRWRRAGCGTGFVRFGRLILYRSEDLETFVIATLRSANGVFDAKCKKPSLGKGTEGSNLNLSASKSELQRNCPAVAAKYAKHARISQYFRQQSEPERTDCSGSKGVDLRAFLWRAYPQSGFNDFTERRQCDYKPMMWRRRVD
jgi:hypothetical protein